MVHFASIISAAALFAGFASALPRPDSAIGNEVAVSAPNGVILSDTSELASQTAAEAASSAAAAGGNYYPAMATPMPAMTTTYAPPPAYTPPTTTSSSYSAAMTYGSGNSNWSGYGSGYDACVQQCVASFGAPPATWTPSPTMASSGGGSGTGSTITVIVAPTQGVLRYIPFAVNASVGDTVRFMWNANNHTVTKSSQLEICNKTSNAPFASGTHDKGFMFDQVVNDTNPTFYYCGTPGHCQKGMFGIINPPASFGANTTVGMQMQNMLATYPQLSAMASYTNSKAASNPQANNWATNMDIGKMPNWSYPYIAENVFYTRTFLAANPDVMQTDGSINMNTNAPLMFPQDISAVSNAASAPSSSSAAPAASTPVVNNAAASSSAEPSATMAPSSNGARSTAVSGGILTIVALAATFLAL